MQSCLRSTLEKIGRLYRSACERYGTAHFQVVRWPLGELDGGDADRHREQRFSVQEITRVKHNLIRMLLDTIYHC